MKNKLVAMFGIKYEPQWLVDQLIENLKGWVDDFAILDCRGRDELWIHEGEYRAKLRQMAIDKGAEWVLVTSPDERWEKNAGEIIRPRIDDNLGRRIYEFDLRELYSPTEYRVDGIWKKIRRRLYPLLPDQVMQDKKIQCSSIPQEGGYEIVHLDVNIYHLKMIEPENRRLRVKVFKKLDPKNCFQQIGYDYLDDEKDLKLEEIQEGREYYPPYKKYLFKVPEKYL